LQDGASSLREHQQDSSDQGEADEVCHGSFTDLITLDGWQGFQALLQTLGEVAQLGGALQCLGISQASEQGQTHNNSKGGGGEQDSRDAVDHWAN
jgi:hypothetical protein